jgi:hypothetical protein
MHRNRLPRANGDGQAAIIRDLQSTKHNPALTLLHRGRAFGKASTYTVPLQTPLMDEPSMTLQYHPLDKPVANVVLHSMSSLLMATKPSDPILCA